MILLWGHPRDAPLAAVARALAERGSDVTLLDQRRPITVSPLRGDGRVTVRAPGTRVDLSAVTAAHLRPYDPLRLPGIARSAAPLPLIRHALRAQSALLAWGDHASALMVNRPSAAAGNAAKARHSQAIGEIFSVPPSVVTDDPSALAEFAERHGRIVAKAGSGVRARVSLADPHDAERIARLATCPTYFQRHIAGSEVRAHVVGDRVFATRIESGAVDYRTAGAGARQHVTRLPDEITVRCLRLTRSLGLRLAGIDLRATPDGEWFCFEANPAPAFTFFDGADQVADAIADLLGRGVRPGE